MTRPPGARAPGADALRFFFLSRSANSNVEFDIELAKKASLDNPVFYVQYGHARLCSILRNGRGARHRARRTAAASGRSSRTPTSSRSRTSWPSSPSVVAEAARLREPHRIVFYVQELARDFQSYFTRLKAEDDPILPPESVRAKSGWEASWDFGKTQARLAWIEAIRGVYAAALDLVGVSAPERMDRPAEERRGDRRRAEGPRKLARESAGRVTAGATAMSEPGSIRNLEQLQEDDDERKMPRGVTMALVVLGGACVVFAGLALGGRTSQPPRAEGRPARRSRLAALAPRARRRRRARARRPISRRATSRSRRCSATTSSPPTALAAVRPSGTGAAASQQPDASRRSRRPPTDRLPVVPLPAQAVLEATPVVTRPRDALTKAASEAAQIELAAADERRRRPAGHEGGYQLQVSSFRTQAEAQGFADQLRARSHKAYVVEAHVPGRGTWFRVRIGPFPTQHAGVEYRTGFEAREHVVPFIVPPETTAKAH